MKAIDIFGNDTMALVPVSVGVRARATRRARYILLTLKFG